MSPATRRPPPVVLPQLCKGCGRCIDACPKHCITMGHEINQQSGLVPVVIDLDVCNGCGVCLSACPEPYGLVPTSFELEDPAHLYGGRFSEITVARKVPDQRVALPPCEPMVMKGNYAAAVGAPPGTK